jgi:ZIP family zinc transporter
LGDLAGGAGWGAVIALSLLGGSAVAALVRLPQRVAAELTAAGGGILLAAVALELVPAADDEAGTWLTAAGLLGGTLLYVGADAWLSRDTHMRMMRRAGHAAAAGRPMRMPPASPDAGRGEAIAAGIFVDGVPESVALGLTIAEGELGVALLAGILLGNLVESYGAAQPIIAEGRSRRFAVGLLGAIGVSLAVATALGATLLADASAALVGTAEAFAAGAVLAVVSIAIIPYAFSAVSSRVAAATVLGFIAGYLLS